MPENARIIQDLSLLYELSLAVGSSLEITSNSQHFFRTLLRRKNLNYAALWLRAEDGQSYHLAASQPAFWKDETTMALDHPLLQLMSEREVFSVASDDPNFEALIQEQQVEKGTYLVYQLKDLGFVKLYARNRSDAATALELDQLRGVMDKFRVSLEGCIAFTQYQKEAQERLAAQKAVERSNAKLLESELKMRKIIDSSLDAVITIDEDGCITEWGQQTFQIFGYTREEALGRRLGDLIVPERFREAHERGMNHFLATGEGPVLNQLLELVGLHKDGHEFPIEISITAIKSDHGYFFSSFIRDITERKKIESALRQSEEKYRGIIENMELGLLEVDRDGKVVRAFDRFSLMTGYSNEELVGRQAEEVLLPKEYQTVLQEQNEDRKRGEANIYEVQLRRKDGELIWVLISGAPIYDSDGNMVGSLGIHYDITERKQLEHDLKEAREVAEKARAAEQQFLANMSHEIRTPMNTVIGMTHLLYESDPSPSQKEYLHALRFSADSLMGVINNILDMSKIEAGKLEFEERPFNLREMLQGLKRTFQFRVREKPISVDINIDAKIENLLLGDPTRLNQILSNLLSNASKFTEAGIIGVDANLLEHKQHKYLLQFVVHDTGIGIEADKLGVIFENFKQADVRITRKYGGTGLGLAIVKELVELQGGTIRAESEPGKGSRFIFEIPFGDSESRASEKRLEANGRDSQLEERIRSLRILVVEDNLMNQKLVRQIFHLWKTDFSLANNGREAVEMTETQEFDLILMDIHMPEMDGFTATQVIRTDQGNLNHRTPIVALTAAALVSEKEAAFRSGMNDFLTKPFSPKQLKNTIIEVLKLNDEKSAADVLQEAAPVSIDLTYLQEFSGGDRIFVREMIETFLSESPQGLQEIQAAATAQDWAGVYKLVHRLKPNLMMLGMLDQQQQCARIEEQIKKGDFVEEQIKPAILQLIGQVEQAFPLLLQELENL